MADYSKFKNITSLLHVGAPKNLPKYAVEDIPVVVIDGKVHPIKKLMSKVEGNTAYVARINQEYFQKLCSLIQVKTIHFNGMRVNDLKPLHNQANLTNLAIIWNTKLIDLSPLEKLKSLKTLILMDTPKVYDLSPISMLTKLTGLQIAGWLWTKNRVHSLNSISKLANLTELRILDVKIENDGLRPLALCHSLKYLDLSNIYPTEEFAYLAAHLPNTECEYFAPWVYIDRTLNGKDIEVTGKRKPHLNSRTDRKLMDKYSKEFSELVRSYSSKSPKR